MSEYIKKEELIRTLEKHNIITSNVYIGRILLEQLKLIIGTLPTTEIKEVK